MGRARLLVSALIAAFTGLFCWLLLRHLHQGAADFTWSIHAAQSLVARKNPYDTWKEQYPLIAAFFGLPFMWMRPEIAAAVLYGASSGALAFGLSRTGWHRLLVFLAYPYWAGILTAQWSPLIMAAAFFGILLPVTMVKPQVGLPVALTHLTRRGVIACVVLLLISLALSPRWPLLWMGQLGYYQHFIPLLVLPGPILLLALWRYRDKDAIFLLLCAVMPQRWFFDSLTLWLIPKSRREILFTAAVSWGAGIWRWYHVPVSFAEVGRWTVIFIYLPMLGVLAWRSFADHKATINLENQTPHS